MAILEKNKSLEQIENDYWKDVEFPSALVKKCYELRKRKLIDLSIDDLRTLISQNIGLEIIMPIALEKLNEDILAEGDFYPGDLLGSMLSRDCFYWKKHQQQWEDFKNIVSLNIDIIKQSNAINDEIKDDLIEQFDKFCNCQ